MYFIIDSPRGVLLCQTINPERQKDMNLRRFMVNTPRKIFTLLSILNLLKIDANPTHRFGKT